MTFLTDSWLLEDDWEQYYRFLLLKAVTDPDDMKIFRVPEDALSTTVAKGKNLYDQFIITEGADLEFGTENPELGQDVGIIPFNIEARFTSMTHSEVKYSVSDHRPIWIRFRIDAGDDD